MVNEKELSFRPYAAPANVIAIVKRARTRNLPEKIDFDFFRIVEVPEAVFGRVAQALRFLSLIDEDNRPTEIMKKLVTASDEEYPQQWESIIKESYKSDFAKIDPTKDTTKKIQNAFQQYQPRSQVSRMVILFLGLCREANMPILEAPRERRMQDSRTPYSKGTLKRTKPEPQNNPSASRIIEGKPVRHAPSDLLFGLTEDDVATLDEPVFNEVWTALGKVALARAKAKKQLVEQSKMLGEETNKSASE